MKSSAKKVELASVDDLFSTEESRADAQRERVLEIPLSELHPFKNHPFKVKDDEAMLETADSIRQYGVLVPAIARPDPEGGYELVAGHRRHRASELAEKETMPVIVRDLDDDAATIIMVDSNLQRESLLPSERAFAYKMKLDAMKHQGERRDLTCAQVGHKSDGKKSRDILAEQVGQSKNQIQRFIRLTELIPELLDMLDERKIALNPAYELSFLKKEEQTQLLDAMDSEQATPSLSQAQRLKKFSQEGHLSIDVMRAIMGEEKKGFWGRLVEGLSKTRDNIVSGIDSLISGFSRIDDDFYEEIEEILVMGDIGINTTTKIIDHLKERVAEEHITDPAECKQLLIESIKKQMDVGDTAYEFENRKSVVLVIGVNGVGKTTSVGKLAGLLKDQGKKVVLAAADTFRAAAGEQLTEWAHRAGVDIIGGQNGADPASIVYDAVAAAKARNADVLICDTAGRLHNKKNLMEELHKIYRILEKEYPEAYLETLVVLDGTTGQNALQQARQFAEVANVTGIILTKLDGTAKGGIAVAIQSELDIPVKYIGVGESIHDLQKFDADQFVNALFHTSEENA